MKTYVFREKHDKKRGKFQYSYILFLEGKIGINNCSVCSKSGIGFMFLPPASPLFGVNTHI